MLTRPGKSKAEVKADTRCHEAEARLRPKNSEAKAEARDAALVIKTPLAHQYKIYQYQEITPSMAVTTVSMHYSKVNFNRVL